MLIRDRDRVTERQRRTQLADDKVIWIIGVLQMPDNKLISKFSDIFLIHVYVDVMYCVH